MKKKKIDCCERNVIIITIIVIIIIIIISTRINLRTRKHFNIIDPRINLQLELDFLRPNFCQIVLNEIAVWVRKSVFVLHQL